MALLVLLVALVTIDLLAWLYGVDSRDFRHADLPLVGSRDAAG